MAGKSFSVCETTAITDLPSLSGLSSFFFDELVFFTPRKDLAREVVLHERHRLGAFSESRSGKPLPSG